jgi:hypothetical protein
MANKVNCSLDWLLLGVGPMSRDQLAAIDPDLERTVSWLRTWWPTASERDRMALEFAIERERPEFRAWNAAHGIGQQQK